MTASGPREAQTGTISEAVRLLRAGDVVALPTETVYGLGADATNAAAVAKIFELKARPFFDPLIVHLPALDWLERAAVIPPGSRSLVDTLVARFWPGPLTLVLPRSRLIPDIVAAGLPTVAVRMSAHPVFRAVIEAFGNPIAAPSANRFGRISPTSAADVIAELGAALPLVVDGGPCAHGLESTIVQVLGNRLSVLRSGPVTAEMLAPFAELTAAPASARGENGPCSPAPAPGMLKSHYAPRTPLRLISDARAVKPRGRSGLLAWQPPASPGSFAKIELLTETCDLREAAARLFSAMRRLDESGLDIIYAEAVPETGLGVAIMDRLRKAAHEN